VTGPAGRGSPRQARHRPRQRGGEPDCTSSAHPRCAQRRQVAHHLRGAWYATFDPQCGQSGGTDGNGVLAIFKGRLQRASADGTAKPGIPFGIPGYSVLREVALPQEAFFSLRWSLTTCCPVPSFAGTLAQKPS